MLLFGVVVIVVVLPTVAMFAMAFYIGDRIVKPLPMARSEKPSTSLPLQPVEFTGESGTLRGWFIPAPGNGTAKRPAILLTHGWGSNAAQMLPYAEFLHQDGYHLALYDVRNHGNSDPDSYVSILRYSNDIIAATQWLASRPEVEATRLGHLGHSMGASSSLRAARLTGLFRCLVFSSGFADIGDLTAWMLQAKNLPVEPLRTLVVKFWEYRLRLPMAEVNPLHNIVQLKLPILLAHGERDTVVPASHMQKLAARALQNSIETLLLPDCQHSNLYTAPAYVKKVRAFFAAHL